MNAYDLLLPRVSWRTSIVAGIVEGWRFSLAMLSRSLLQTD
jgi:hypothetical protein